MEKTNKDELLKKKKRILLKKREEKKALKTNKKLVETKLVTDAERLKLSEDMKANAAAVFARFDFYKDGYLKSVGVLVFSIMTLAIASYSVYYSSLVFKAPNVYLPVNSISQLVDPVPLDEALFTDNEVRRFASDAFSAISNYNYVTVNSNYFTNISEWFTPNSFMEYKNQFNKSSEIKVVKENFFVVNKITVKEATINEVESLKLRNGSSTYLWVVNLKSRRVYQNRTGFTYEDYDTRMIITRSPVRINERGLAVHSIVNEKSD